MKIVTAAIIVSGNKILIARRKIGEKLEGYWEFPGGKIKKGETPEKCLSRELFEEFGIKTKIGEQFAESIYQYNHGIIKLVAFITEILSGDIILTVHDKIEWVESKELLNYKLAPADIPIATEVAENVW